MNLVESCIADANERWSIFELASAFAITEFEQTWGSTALGFGGLGGAALTSATTTVLFHPVLRRYAVYFAGRHAYDVGADSNSENFQEDLNGRRWMVGLRDAPSRYPLFHNPTQPIDVTMIRVKSETDRNCDELVYFEPAVRFDPTLINGMVAFVRTDLDIAVAVPWRHATWDRQDILGKLVLALIHSWRRHVVSHDGSVVEKNLLSCSRREHRVLG